MITNEDIQMSRRWLAEHATATHVRHVLERGLEYLEAVTDAGLAIDMVDGDELYRFLSDPSAATARQCNLLESPL